MSIQRISKGQLYMSYDNFAQALKAFKISNREFCEILGISEQTLYYHKRRNRFPAGYYGIFKSDLQAAWIKELNHKIKIFEEIFNNE